MATKNKDSSDSSDSTISENSTFTKEQLYKSKKYSDHKDIIEAIFDNDVAYTLDDADKLINDFKRKAVK